MRWVEKELSGLRPEIEELKRFVHKVIASCCTSGSCISKLHLLIHLANDLERFGCMSFTDAAFFENFAVLVRRSYRVTY